MSFLPKKEELSNALAWFMVPVNGAVQKGKETANDIADWLWVVIQGDFATEPSTAQVVTGTVVSMIPLVDQICDVRDICANCKKINEDDSNPWAWVGLILTLIGLFPVLGSLFKGIFKVLLAPIRRFMMRPLSKAGKFSGSLIYKAVEPAIEQGIKELNKFLGRPAVKKLIRKEASGNVYRWSAKQLRSLKAKVNKTQILTVFDEHIGYLKETVEFVQKYGSSGIGKKAADILKVVVDIRNRANRRLGEFLAPVQDFLERLAIRLDAEGGYKAVTNLTNVANFRKVHTDGEVQLIKISSPKWVDVTRRIKYPKVEECPKIPKGYPNISDKGKGPLWKKFNTFHDMKAVELKQGTSLYRVVDPTSNDNSICWMRASEYLKLKKREDWRRRFAVWASWNSNGEVVHYIVPKGGMKVWEGKAASQILENSKGQIQTANGRGAMYVLEGGGKQIVLDPAQLIKSRVKPRRKTGWGYGSDLKGLENTDMVGVPTLKQNWYK
ncbi:MULTISPECIES: hypothetical protein [Psychrobacter]|jgi:hypothetical protein|uniref:hypothetical protein n=3 Tax=Moraxellaceae TaxID=468 RepID=UPI0019181F2D|nr:MULTISPECIES: hypothetical protein [Psychrobacter]MCG3873299.1 hypothetical protein [Psychrobacter sp. Ps7]